MGEISNFYNKENIEFFLGDDIIQGEFVPFYILWKDISPTEIEIQFEGFKDVIEIHNGIESTIQRERNKIVVGDFHVPGYLGGVLSTELSNRPTVNATLNINIKLENGEVISLKKDRTLYTTKIDLSNLPDTIFCSESKIEYPIEITLNGITTIFLEIETMEDNEVPIDIPSDVREAIDKFFESVTDGLEDLKQIFPEHQETIDLLLEIPKGMSELEYLEKIEEKLEESFKDEDFLEAVASVIIVALFGRTSIRDRILLPIIEYFESGVADKAYLNPLLHIRVPKGESLMAIRIKGKNILREECSRPLDLKVRIKADNELLIPIKEILAIRRG